MKPTWTKYLLYGSAIIVVGTLAFILIETIRLKNTGFETKTLWDWMDLFIIPLALAAGAIFLERSERAVEREIAENRAKLEREIAMDRQREAALQSYLDRMAELLLKENLRAPENEEVRNVARIQTLAVLRGLDAKRKGMVLLFLYESGLIADEPSISLSGADLTGADLRGARLKGAKLMQTDLSHADLEGAFLWLVNLMGANLSEANLRETKLMQANLVGANLSKADLYKAYLVDAYLLSANLTESMLREADLKHADLKHADLSEAKLYIAHLEQADLGEANLTNADLTHADLSEANLSLADLSGARISAEQLATVKSLEGAIMPDGTKHD
jgi:uncharacterized protein YjbI with pentapeptide repeats